MSGHSKWSTIKHKKGALDAKRGKMFTKLIKELTVAARLGGGDLNGNPRLRKAVADAKAINMPSDNIKRAVQKGTGELEGTTYEEITYEGYGPGGAAILVDAMTDNKNRTVSELRYTFSKNAGNLGEGGCVAWMFSKKGYIIVEKSKAPEDELMEIVLEAGGEDLKEDGPNWEIFCAPEQFETVLEAVKKKNIEVASSEVGKYPQNYVKLEGKQAHQMLKLMEALEDHDDVQHVWANFDISEEEMERAG
jgi:YebC/PmpR family DNA-binding regulatory protein